MKRIFIYTILLLFNASVLCQVDQGYLELAKAESQLKSMFDNLYNEEVLGLNINLFRKIDTLFSSALSIPGSFDYSWDKLDKIGKLVSDDKKVKVFSWLYRTGPEDYHYSCYIQLNNNKDKSEVFKLEPGLSKNYKREDFAQELNSWHPKIYYEILTTQHKRKTFYTLIGADFNDEATTIKTIEVLAIQREKPVFRGDQFLDGGKVKDRIVLEYSADLSISVRFNKQLNMIVFDHLVPLHPLYHGNFQFYGPDGSYDGFSFIDGIWVKEEDVDARNRE